MKPRAPGSFLDAQNKARDWDIQYTRVENMEGGAALVPSNCSYSVPGLGPDPGPKPNGGVRGTFYKIPGRYGILGIFYVLH